MVDNEPVTIFWTTGDAVMVGGVEDIDLRQPNQIFAAGNAGDIHRRRQLIGREFNVRMGVNPLAQRAQGLREHALRDVADGALELGEAERAARQRAVLLGAAGQGASAWNAAAPGSRVRARTVAGVGRKTHDPTGAPGSVTVACSRSRRSPASSGDGESRSAALTGDRASTNASREASSGPV